MSIISLVLVLLVFGFIAYMLTTVPIPIHPWIKTLILGILVFALVIYLLGVFGVNTGFHMHLT